MINETARRARAQVVTVCAASAIAAALLAPLAARPLARTVPSKPQSESAAGVYSGGSPWGERPVLIARDPFLPAAEPRPTVIPSADVHTVAVPPPIAVRAIALGENSRALVDVAGITRLVAVGDSIGSLKIAAILMDRIVFSDGSAAKLESGLP